MSLGEFNLIEKYFTANDSGEGIALGIGDDCALINIPLNTSLAVTTDTLNEGIHFFKDTDPYLLGYKSLLVNVSDLAAMGAQPYCFTLSITLPDNSEEFLDGFSKGLFTLANKLKMPLVGGNTSKGPLSVTISAYGLIRDGKCLRRDRAKEGDYIYVTGTLGLPALAVDLGYKKLSLAEDAFDRCYKKSMLIEDRCSFAMALTEVSVCALDISDGLIGDLKHILERSGKGAIIEAELLPKPYEFALYNLDEDYTDRLCLSGGGDYELLFTVPQDNETRLFELAESHQVQVTRVGVIKKCGLSITKRGRILDYSDNSFKHF